jgi:lysine 6-dehydrogenase
VVEGDKDGDPRRVVAESVIGPDPGTGLGGGARDTGIPPSIVAQMIGSGEIERPGMFAPEDVVDPDRFFEELGRRGIKFGIRMEQ